MSPNTINSLLISAGRASATYRDLHIRNIRAKRVQCDEIWSFVYAKQQNLSDAKAHPPKAGDIWTWLAIDVDTKLIVSYLVGGRGMEAAKLFMHDLAGRLEGRVALTTDAHGVYSAAIEEAFGG